MENKKCCICGCKIEGWGNNPWGALDVDLTPIEWKDEDRCCDECNLKRVIFGRLILSRMSKKERR